MLESIKSFIRKLLDTANTSKLTKLVHKKKIKWSPPPLDGKIRLNLGCGDKILEGYINVDFAESRKGNKPDVIADLRALKFDHDFADEILSVHVIEHFYQWEAEDLLNHWKHILKPKGKLVLECPNILTAAAMLLKDPARAARAEGKDGQMAMWPLYGDPAWKDPLMCHRWGYTPTTLIDLLKRCGFNNVHQEASMFKQQDPRDMRITGEK
jgi:hypothetical protein